MGHNIDEDQLPKECELCKKAVPREDWVIEIVKRRMFFGAVKTRLSYKCACGNHMWSAVLDTNQVDLLWT